MIQAAKAITIDGRGYAIRHATVAGTAPGPLLGNAAGAIFTNTGVLPPDVAISAEGVTLIGGTTAGGSSAALLIQANSRQGTNWIAAKIASGIHRHALLFPTLSSTSVMMRGIGYPTPSGNCSSLKIANVATPWPRRSRPPPPGEPPLSSL